MFLLQNIIKKINSHLKIVYNLNIEDVYQNERPVDGIDISKQKFKKCMDTPL